MPAAHSMTRLCISSFRITAVLAPKLVGGGDGIISLLFAF